MSYVNSNHATVQSRFCTSTTAECDSRKVDVLFPYTTDLSKKKNLQFYLSTKALTVMFPKKEIRLELADSTLKKLSLHVSIVVV